jgi:hypothetical protein
MLAIPLFLLSWLLPLHFPPWVSWHLEAVAFFAVLLLGWSGWVRMRRASASRIAVLPFAALPLIAFGAVVTLQRAAGLLPFWGSVWALWFYIALCVACLMLGFAAASASAPTRPALAALTPFTLLAFTLCAGAAVSTIVAFAQVFGLWEHSEWIARMPDLRRPGGNLGQPNHLATLLVMGVASLVFLRQSKKLGPTSASLLLLLLCMGLAVSESRAGALSLLLLLGWWLFKRRTIGDATPPWVGLAVGITFVGMFLVWPHMLNVMDLLPHQATGRVVAGSLRLQVWSQLLKAVTMHPWTGWGFHQVAAAHNAVVDGYSVSEPYAYSHNLVLDLVIWTGVPITLLLLATAAVWLWRRIRDANQLLPWYGLAVALPLGLHSMLEYPFAYAYFLAPVILLLGAVEATAGGKAFARIGVKAVGAVLLACTVVLAWSVVEYLEIEEDFRVARFQASRIGSPPIGHERPKVVLFDQLGVLLDVSRITPAPNMSAQDMEVAKRAALYYPWTATQARYAMALALNGNPEEAARQLQVIRRLWGEKQYQAMKEHIADKATQYPQLLRLNLP